jgi:2-polyprenyl-3-methyl-5-hydroxy-6-metoxy-1,4-benzoquinol methylase
MDLTSKTSAEKYKFAFDLDSDHAGAQILRLIGDAKNVLEIGAGPGSISRPLIDLTGCRMTALELDPSSIAILRTFCDEVVQGDLNDPDWVKALPRTDFDTVIIADVLEHLFDPWSTLRQVSEVVSEDGFVIVSIPHTAHAAIMACLLVDDIRYGEWGLLDKTHIRFFGMKNIQALFEGAGFKIVDARFVMKHPSETEFADVWQKLSDDQRSMLEAQPHAEVYQVVAKLAPAKHHPELGSRCLSELLVPEPAEVTYLAFYLPQFHPVPENDEWWGKGFTEWTNVTKAPQLFEGHYQPHLPADFGFYDLRLRDVQRAQIECAKKFGVDAFCFHYYWFGGRRILQRPVDEFLADQQADIKFCLCWANENWTRNWDASEHEVLIEQQYSPEYDIAFIESLLPFFRDHRHVRVDGAPVLVVYRPQQIPDALATTQRWREVCRQEGIGEIHLVAALTHGNFEYESFGFDAGVEFPPHNVRVHNYRDELNASHPLEGLIVRHSDVAENYLENDYRQRLVYRGIYPSWDNTARMPGRGLVTLEATPECYERWLNHATNRTLIERKPSQRMIFINAWNEWAEGCHLEPDRRYGHAFLEATLRVKQRRSLLQSAFQTPEPAVPVPDVQDMPTEHSDPAPDMVESLPDVVEPCAGVELSYAEPAPPRPVIHWVARRLYRYPLMYRIARLVWGDIRTFYARTRRFATSSQR